MEVTFVGSAFLLLLIMANLIKQISGLILALTVGFSLTLGCLGLYVAISIMINYASLDKLDQVRSALIGGGFSHSLCSKLDPLVST